MKIKTHIYLLIIFFIAIIFTSCTSKKVEKVTNKNDYKAYLEVGENKKIAQIKTEIDFWSAKLQKAPNQSSYLILLASYYSQLFQTTGKIDHLYKSEALLLDANKKFINQNAGIHRSIARNYISQHRFKEALSYLKSALALGENKLATHKMLFDAYMELGNYELANKSLSYIQNQNDFDYLIRLAKWNDYKGNLDLAISSMEQALKIAETDNNTELKIWVYSNIADFYGHAGKINTSYQYYLKTLKEDPHNSYALKGIAWIIFSHERNSVESLEIIKAIESNYFVPDIYLLKADIYEYQNDTLQQEQALNTFYAILQSKNYGDMYNKYVVLLKSENKKTVLNAIEIAQKEVLNRPTAASYDLLAWSYFKSGAKEKALDIIQKHTINKSFEPDILYHNAEILKANNKLEAILPLKNELLSSIYELGPGLEKNINNL